MVRWVINVSEEFDISILECFDKDNDKWQAKDILVNGVVVGDLFVDCAGGNVLLAHIDLEKAGFARKGVGTKIVEYVLRHFSIRNECVDNFDGKLYALPSNDGAKIFFKKLGFEEDELDEDLFFDFDAIGQCEGLVSIPLLVFDDEDFDEE